MNKPHLLKATDPIPEFQDYVCACGKMVKKAKFEFRLDPEEVDVESLSAIANCRECVAKLFGESHQLGRCYIYGLVESQEQAEESVA